MIRFAGYQVVEQLHQSARTLVYRATSTDGQPVVIKTTASSHPSLLELATFNAEFQIGRRVEHPSVIRYHRMDQAEHRPTLILEDTGGQSLAQRLKDQPLSISRILDLALQLTAALGGLHEHGITHKDINPANLILSQDSNTIKVIDLSIASLLSLETLNSPESGMLEGTLRYISPEQTGRMNRSVDYRTDFYSLGITLYEMLGKRSPFESDDPLELVHAHLAKTPPSLTTLDPTIPAPLSAVVAKLMAKMPEERYQSAEGIAADLRFCQELIQGKREVRAFVPGMRDINARFQLPHKLYGRQKERDQLLAALERTISGSRHCVALVAPPGAGKSTLAHELRGPLEQRGGWFVAGKYQQTEEEIPYAGFITALRQLIPQLLTGSEEQVERWRLRLRRAIQGDGQLLMTTVPEIGLLIGEQPTLPKMSAEDAERRFNRLALRFIRALTAEGEPLVILLDNIQWADRASLQLMEQLMGDTELHHLMLIVSHRDDLLSPADAAALTLRAIEDGPALVSTITLGPLEVGHVAQIIADTLHRTASETQPLAELVRRKSAGNPQFIRQLLRTLYTQKLLVFDRDAGHWQWDINRISQLPVTDSLADLLVGQIHHLPPETGDLLRLAACVGPRFDIQTIVLLTQKSVQEVVALLLPAIDEGVITTICGGFGRLVAVTSGGGSSMDEMARFVQLDFHHDRVQQALYQELPHDDRLKNHLKLGRMLREVLSSEELPPRILEVVNHFNVSDARLMDGEERTAVASLNLQAGQRVLNSLARHTAERYFAKGIALLPEDRWDRFHTLTFDLYLGRISSMPFDDEVAPEARSLGQELLDNAATIIEKLRALSQYVIRLSAGGYDPEQALALGLAALREVGIDLDPEDLDRAVSEKYQLIQERLSQGTIAELINLPLMTDETTIAAMELLQSGIIFPLYMRHRELLPLAMMTGVQVSLESGYCPATGPSFTGFGQVVAHVFGDYRQGYQLGRLGVEVTRRQGINDPFTQTIFAVTTAWLQDPLQEVYRRLQLAFRDGVANGIQFSTFSAGVAATYGMACSVPLEELKEECRTWAAYIESHTFDIGIREIHLVQRLIETLQGHREDPTALFSRQERAQDAVQVMSARNPEGLQRYYLYRTRLELLFGEAREALAAAEASEMTHARDIGRLGGYELIALHALAICAVYPTAGAEERPALERQLQEKQTALEHFVVSGAEIYFSHHQQLVVAEAARIRGEHATAGPAYEKAITAAGKQGFHQDQALANELAGKYYLEQGLEKIAAVYLKDAYYCYEKWGATAKLRQLERIYAHLELGAIVAGAGAESSRHGSSTNPNQTLDLSSVIKSSQTISSEVVLGALLQKLLRSVVQNTGAERGFLLLLRDDGLTVEAATGKGPDEVVLVDSEPISAGDRLSAGIAQYVARTRQPVVLEDAARAGLFQTDPYVNLKRPRSVLCAPLINQAKVLGVIYLENNLARGTFTAERLEVVNLIGAQAAISIENARLYSELEQTNRKLAETNRTLERKVTERTEDLAGKNQQLNASLRKQREMQDQLLLSEKMASLGNLSAGLAHEINTPVGAVVSATDTTWRAIKKLELQIGEARTLDDLQGNRRILRLFELLKGNNEVLTTASERVIKIINTLRNFARLDEAERKEADLHEGIESTLTLVRHRIKDSIAVIKEYGELDPVLCYPNQLNQVFMNLIVNAIDAIEDKAARPGPGGEGKATITIRTYQAEGHARVEISDTGTGIPVELRKRIFEPGFTTKGVGVGTGLGLSICFNIIQKHEGELLVQEAPGGGSTMIISLPLS